MAINVPNQITLGRLVLALVFFGLLSTYQVDADRSRDWMLAAAFWIFLAAAISDAVDGWLARRWNQVTVFGRVVDPVVDKIMVVGAFIFFASGLFVDPATNVNLTGVAPWMAVVVLLRELLVSAIRALAESGGEDFSATLIGKLKMVVQSTAACIVLGVLAWFEDSLAWLRVTAVWATVVVTVISMISYVRRAPRAMFQLSAGR